MRAADPTNTLLIPIPDVGPKFLGGLGLTKTYELISSGDLHKVNIGRRGFITQSSVEAYVARLESAQ
jgi:hypothetical protein